VSSETIPDFTPDFGEPPAFALSEVVQVFERWLHLPDPGVLFVALGGIAANRLPGEPVWPMIVGPSGGGKTEILRAASDLQDVRYVGTLTEASLLSGTSAKEKAHSAKGGLLRELGEFGVIVLKDFGSILTLHGETRAGVVQALRDIYDGFWTRSVGTDGGKSLEWAGKVGLVAGCTPAIDQHAAVLGELGERLIFYRLTVDDHREHARRSLEHAASAAEMRDELRDAVTGLFEGIDLANPPARSEADDTRLTALASLVVRARSPVIRDPRTREIELVPDAEAPGRLVNELANLLTGLRTIGVGHAEAARIVTKVGLDSMTALRWRALRAALELDGAGAKLAHFVVTLDVPKTTVTRILEDLAAHRVLGRTEEDAGPTWWVRQDIRALYLEAVGVPEISEDPLSNSSKPTSADISGTTTEAKE
jgi:hypothetical protein